MENKARIGMLDSDSLTPLTTLDWDIHVRRTLVHAATRPFREPSKYHSRVPTQCPPYCEAQGWELSLLYKVQFSL
ncbi:hypothetical protein Mapa_017174 [Marchantia paleacea]|nr:hypothetical protein Mapa_017174 [Marchantia paleacea]